MDMNHTISKQSRKSLPYFCSQMLMGGAVALLVFLSGCASQPLEVDARSQADLSMVVDRKDTDKLFIVDCLLPAQVRRMGSAMTFLAPRQALKTSALACEIRGGEYVAYNRADFATALKVWMTQAETGDPEAQNYVGEIYERGLGVVPDFAAAAIWYERAAKQGYSKAQLNLGYLYEKGLGVELNIAKAMNLYREASGLPEDVEFVSSIEMSAKNEQISALQNEVDQLSIEQKELKQQLEASQIQAASASRQQQQLEKELISLRDELEVLAQKDATSELTIKLQQDIALREKSLATQRKIIAKLGQQALKFKAQLSDLSEKQFQMAAAPTIELYDPLLRLTRGVPTVRMRSISSSQEVSGRVNAPAGIKSFLVNQQPVTVDDIGVFSTDIEVTSKERAISLVVTDRHERTATLDFFIKKAETGKSDGAVNAQQLSGKGISFGRYHALIIGNNDYVSLPKLKTAENDALEIEQVLREKYGFSTTLLLNADRHQIVSALYSYKERLTEDDNLLVYYAGHGELDRINDRGYWLPVDAELDNPVNWISNVSVTDMLNTMAAKHIMVVADSCYSGSMTSTSVARVDASIPAGLQEKWLKLMAKSRSRTVLTSGGLQPVLDSGGGDNSVFAQAFLSALKHQDGLIQGYALYREVTTEVQQRAAQYGVNQVPEYAPIKHAGHETGQFFLVSDG